jgi:hypothetical protein
MSVLKVLPIYWLKDLNRWNWLESGLIFLVLAVSTPKIDQIMNEEVIYKIEVKCGSL